jgi:hypothetical protein
MAATVRQATVPAVGILTIARPGMSATIRFCRNPGSAGSSGWQRPAAALFIGITARPADEGCHRDVGEFAALAVAEGADRQPTSVANDIEIATP